MLCLSLGTLKEADVQQQFPDMLWGAADIPPVGTSLCSSQPCDLVKLPPSRWLARRGANMSNIDFRRPPLVEVSFGVQFKRLPNLRSGHFGLFWSMLIGDFPEASDQVPIGLQDGIEGVWPLPRVWLVHKDKALLLQLQNDRFHLNWRRLQKDAEYPRFKVIAPLFQRYWEQWTIFLAENGVGSVEPVTCELSYVNHLELAPKQTVHDAASLLKPLSAIGAASALPPPDALSWQNLYNLEGRTLTADLKTLLSKTSTEKRLQFELKCQSALGQIHKGDDVVRWMESANDTIVSSFVNLTSERAQRELWKRVS